MVKAQTTMMFPLEDLFEVVFNPQVWMSWDKDITDMREIEMTPASGSSLSHYLSSG
jgi:hypothetical protein